jgi:uncharacterized UPF0146 family protein
VPTDATDRPDARGRCDAALRERLARYDRLVEVGVGRRVGVAAGLAARGRDVVAVDVHARETPAGVPFVRDDVLERAAGAADDPGPYDGADAVYGLNLPPELHRPARDVARAVGADCLFTTLGGDPPAVPASAETLPGTTLFRATER